MSKNHKRRKDINPLLPFTYVDQMRIICPVDKKKPLGIVATNPQRRDDSGGRAPEPPELPFYARAPAGATERDRSVDTREAKAIELADRGRVIRNGDRWLVFSLNSSERYEVTLKPLSCTCANFETTHEACKHALAARISLSREDCDFRTEAKPEHPPVAWPRPTYKQDWPNYDLAQQQEKAEFRRLLADLCSNLPEPASQKGTRGGKPPARLSDTIFATLYKIYSGMSGRRFATDLREAQEQGYVSQALSHSKIAKCLEDKETTAILINLIEVSALPFAAIEDEFAVDSSGFSSCKFDRWYDEKWGRMMSKHSWVKAHAMCGTTTHVVTSVIITDKNSNDSPHFPPLIRATAKSFTIRQASADKAYSGNENYQAVADCGGTAYIAFRANATGGVGGIYEHMYHQFCLKKDEYLHHYHRRSNVESLFSAVKRLFGDAVRSKNDTAMKNEVLGKLLAFNITLLVHAIYELGLEPKLGSNSSRDDSPAILPFVRRA
jgi:transposase